MILSPSKKTNESISSLANLAKALDLTLDELEYIRKIPEEVRFTRVKNEKLAAKKRIVYRPHKLIRKIQDRIKNRIFKTIVIWPEYLFGSIPNTLDDNGFIDSRDYISCAKLHCGAKSIFKIDIENFFGNVHRDHVFIIFNKFFKYDDLVSEYLTDICCKDNSLPQGALTSSYIASLCFWDKEENVVKKLRRKNLIYTRLVDDITVSSKTSNFNFEYVQKIISDMLISKDLPLNKNKTKVLYAGLELTCSPLSNP